MWRLALGLDLDGTVRTSYEGCMLELAQICWASCPVSPPLFGISALPATLVDIGVGPGLFCSAAYSALG